MRTLLPLALSLTLAACSGSEPPAPVPQPDVQGAGADQQKATPDAPASAEDTALQQKAATIFKPLPDEPPAGENELTEARIDLGRMLYYETRLSKNHDISCNSCHQLDNYGVDGKPTSPGHKGQLGGRNSPTVYNASLHVAQFWDGRAKDVEEQAGGPMLNPVEMAMPDGETVTSVLKSIPGYEPLFKAAFPGVEDPIDYQHAAIAIGAFERKLLTPAPIDRYLKGEIVALTPEQRRGMETFMEVGCITCHAGGGFGGHLYQKMGLIQPYETEDLGRFDVTGKEEDKFFFKVPSLRNIEHTGPYFHDGSVETLDEAIKLMGTHQLGKELTDAQVGEIKTFLGSLTGEIPGSYIAKPDLPESGPETPAPDPS